MIEFIEWKVAVLHAKIYEISKVKYLYIAHETSFYLGSSCAIENLRMNKNRLIIKYKMRIPKIFSQQFNIHYYKGVRFI